MMAYVPVPKLVSINKNVFKSTERTTTLPKLLKTGAVKRLINQPAKILKAKSMKATTSTPTSNLVLTNKINGVKIVEKPHTQVEVPQNPASSASPCTVIESRDFELKIDEENTKRRIKKEEEKEKEEKDDEEEDDKKEEKRDEEETEEYEEERLLPSKTNGQPQVTIQNIVPKKKSCGHYEPCEEIISDVIFQTYADENGITPLLTMSIEDDEIDAKVTKHCEIKQCDALNIDHNRCRRAVIKLYKFDENDRCDICGVLMRLRKIRANHKNCKNKHNYQHIDTPVSEIRRCKMREREIQLLMAAKRRTHDYLDPVNGTKRALESIKRNDQLIVTAKAAPQQSPSVTITAIPPTNSQQIPIMIQPQGLILNATQQKAVITRGTKPGQVLQSPFVTVTTVPQVQQMNNISPVILGNWIAAGNQTTNQASQVNCDSTAITNILQQLPNMITTPMTIQPKSFLTPIRVVPIANYKSEPSLLHQAQGMPKFCIMADTTSVQATQILQPPPLVRLQPIQPNNNPTNAKIVISNVASDVKQKKPIPALIQSPLRSQSNKKEIIKRLQNRKELIKNRSKSLPNRVNKTFVCPYCSKKLGTDWYFKMHVARHKGDMPYVCKICEKTFVNKYEVKKHFTNKHNESDIRCEFCNHVAKSETALNEHMRTKQPNLKCSECNHECSKCEDMNVHQKMTHGFVKCKLCSEEIPYFRFKRHVILRHDMTKTKAEEEAEKVFGEKAMEEEIQIVVPEEKCNGTTEVIDLEEEMEVDEETDEMEEVEEIEDTREAEEFEDVREIEEVEQVDEIDTEEVEETETEEIDEIEEAEQIDEIEEEFIDDEEMRLEIVESEVENEMNEITIEDDDEDEDRGIDENEGALCNSCGNIFPNKQSYSDHLETCSGDEGDLYINEGILDEDL